MLALASLAARAPVLAAEPDASFDDRVDFDGFLQLTSTVAPPGFLRPPDAFAVVLPSPAGVFLPSPTVPFGERAQVLLRLGPAPELRDAGVPSTIAAQVGTPDEVARWLTSLRALAHDPAAKEAVASERRDLAPLLDSFRAKLSSAASVAAIEEYTGLPLPGPHHLVLSPFHAASGVANVIADQDDGTVSVTSLFGPDRSNGAPDFWSVRVPGTLWHEEAHGITDPLAVAYAARIERARPADTDAICYGEWRQCVREHVVRAVMLRLIERRLGPGAAAEQLAFEEPARFRWLLPMVDLLKTEYETERAHWPTLADYYPRLLDAIRPDADEDAPPLRPEREPSAVRARLVVLAKNALPKMKDPRALAHLKRAAALAGTKLDLTRAGGAGPRGERKTAALAARGVAAFQAGRRDEALALFDTALKEDPGDAEAEMSRALIMEVKGRRDEALAGYGRAADSARRRPETFPPHVLADALSSRARLLLAAGRPDEARRDLDAALAAAPKDWNGRAEAQKLLGQAR